MAMRLAISARTLDDAGPRICIMVATRAADVLSSRVVFDLDRLSYRSHGSVSIVVAFADALKLLTRMAFRKKRTSFANRALRSLSVRHASPITHGSPAKSRRAATRV